MLPSLPTLSILAPAATPSTSGQTPPPLVPVTSMAGSWTMPQGTMAIVLGGMFMGHTLLPLPTKLVKKITNLEFVDMAELKPESWLLDEEDRQQAKCCHTPSRRRTPVRDILTWVQCFASYVSV